MFELAQGEGIMLREIADPQMKRLDIAKTYALTLRSSEYNAVDWARVNQAIVDRWSPYALEYIKKLAWSGRAFRECYTLSPRSPSED